MELIKRVNILSQDGETIYFGKVLTGKQADTYFWLLLENILWKNDEAVIFGRRIITKRMVAWYGDKDFPYSYSKTTRHALQWTKELLELKKLAEELTGASYNSCLLNLYHDGEEGMGWHSDDEKSLGLHSSIASLSFGAERKFSIKHRVTKETHSLVLEAGSLLEMKGSTQAHWIHSLPKSKKVTEARINLTFRTMI